MPFIIPFKMADYKYPVNNRIQIKHIPQNITDAELYNLCAEFGEILFYDVLNCKRNLVFVTYLHATNAKNAIDSINMCTKMKASSHTQTGNDILKQNNLTVDSKYLELQNMPCKGGINRNNLNF